MHSPISPSGAAVEESKPTAPVTSTPRSVASGVSVASGDSGIGNEPGDASGESVEKIQQQLAITTQELMETKEALEKSEKMVSEMKERGEAGGKDKVQRLC